MHFQLESRDACFSRFSVEIMEVTPKGMEADGAFVQKFTSCGASQCDHKTFSFKPRDKNLVQIPNGVFTTLVILIVSISGYMMTSPIIASWAF